MEGYLAQTYGERIAPIYDQRHPAAAPEQVDLLAELAGTGPALELGIGTGRLALPLATRGVEMHGIDASPAMVELLRAKPGGSEVTVRIGDFADFDLGRRFALVFVAFNTLFALPSQQAQVSCFRAVARHLTPGGRFLIEAFVPDLSRFDRGQRVNTTSTIELDQVGLDCSVHDPVAQRVTTQHITVGPGGIDCYPVEIRYAWPSELDLMACLAGLEPEARWGGWDCRPFSSECAIHLSLWRSPTEHHAPPPSKNIPPRRASVSP
ncbi:MAG: class I SAM-dependent DNA methyltransferase [Pseudonocardiaceae bacterium]